MKTDDQILEEWYNTMIGTPDFNELSTEAKDHFKKTLSFASYKIRLAMVGFGISVKEAIQNLTENLKLR